ncbi:hypothetical protein AGDE_15352 [Angomonas deanei]|uniref:Uncharacterized protein n=1 Tax=Angomonas deanei TaxID=59799 RepID=A0A7G2C970_9TRYP|nr:hypothetical protein AGDE_15352 [Angomonas deanei]CAD2216089.1 hypothetical protein, conserved [Angomonas deanei]|eukprot:EPY19229.1 hypothetical protein AGDE_15352 [Angomonas deanei]
MYNGKCIQCNVPNCKQCISTNVCSACENENQVVSGNKCVTKIDHCEVPDPSGVGCSKCEANYKASGNGCVRCAISDCGRCDTDNKCSVCLNGLTLNKDNTACVKALPNCIEQMTNNACEKCKSGYTINDASQCTICQIDGCGKCNEINVCSACQNGYKFSDDKTKCEPVCNVPNCHQCGSTDKCVSCEVRFGANSNGQCIACTDPNCKFCSGDKPDQCTEEFTKEELEGKKIPWWAWLLVGIGAALLVGFIIFMIVWCCRDPPTLYVEYEENYDEYGKSGASSSSSGSMTSSSKRSSSRRSSSGRSSTDDSGNPHNSGVDRGSSRSSGSSSSSSSSDVSSRT